MRIVRMLWLLIPVLMAGALLAPTVAAEPPMRLPDYVTDEAGALTPQQRSEVSGAVQQLYDKRGTRLWVVYVDTFGDADPRDWAETTWRKSFLGDDDAILAVAIKDRAYALLVREAATGNVDVDRLRRDVIEAKLHKGDWAGAGVAAADGLRAPTRPFNWVGLIAALAVIGVALAGLIWWARRRRTQRRRADLNAAHQADATDPAVLAKMSPETLEDLSKSLLVEVDNAVRTSDNELALAVGEFGDRDTAPFIAAVQNAKNAMAQAFSVRQILDDAVPETPQQRRDLLRQLQLVAVISVCLVGRACTLHLGMRHEHDVHALGDERVDRGPWVDPARSLVLRRGRLFFRRWLFSACAGPSCDRTAGWAARP